MASSTRLKEFSQYSELKQLAFSIAILQRQKGFHSLAVLSFFPGEGKTLFCATTAMAYAEAARGRVLVVDATTRQNEGALVLRECFTPPIPNVEVTTMDEIRHGAIGLPGNGSKVSPIVPPPIHTPEIVESLPLQKMDGRGTDSSLLRSATDDVGKSYDLVLMDTAAMNSKNRSNIDPLVVARQSDASVLIVGRKLLKTTELNTYLKIARDPTIRLLGIVANEEFES